MSKGAMKEKWADLKKSSRFYRFSGGADGSDVSPDDSGQSACRGAARPRCPETRRFRHVFGVRLRWPDGHAEFPQLPEGPKQAATERVGCGRGSVITFRPHRELRISTV